MIRLSSKDITQDTATYLADKQADIDAKPDYDTRRSRAKTLWNGKKGSNAGKAAFDEIKTSLLDMAVGIEICNYCELNEGTDIEHIHPKDWYPEKTFAWRNYLLACRTCNTDHKNNKFAVINSLREVLHLNGEPPQNTISALVDPRLEDPMEYLWLNVRRGVFIPHPDLLPETDKFLKAEYTLELLALNNRNTLVSARVAAAITFLDRLKRYSKVSSANSINELRDAVNPLDLIIEANPLEDEKNRLCENIRQSILTSAHPTVWEELKRQRESPEFVRTNALFNLVPEALDW